ncbi:hypothetical protein [Sulfurimonas sp.]|uniref:hypothetical protein n=1 Tax=Sulfurimonas sp. TaxID=2022749 RepID=UPI002AB009D0|nr:hypothetical protein [Sulfurimonas sp.]
MTCNHHNCDYSKYENDLCIFHCDKQEWVNEDYEIDDTLEKWDKYKIEFFWEKFNSLEENQLNQYIFPYFSNEEYKKDEVSFEECLFLDDVIIKNYVKNKLEFNNCTFKSSTINIKNDMEFFIFNQSLIENNSCVIEIQESKIINSEISNLKNKFCTFIFQNCILEKCKFIKSETKVLNMNNVKLVEKSTLIIENIVVEKFYLEKVSQKADYIQFNNIKILKYLKFHKIEFANTYFNNFNIEEITGSITIDKTSFDGAKFNLFLWGNISKINASRDTFRQLKYVLDEQEDYIQANNFFVMEMKKYKEELKTKSGVYWQDKLIFSINEHISDFGRNWFLSMLWFLAISLFLLNILNLHCSNDYNHIFPYSISLFLIYLGSIKNKLFNITAIMLVFNLYYSYMVDYNSFNQFANFLNLKLQNEFKNYSFLWFMHKLLASFVLYHFVIAIRRQTKR